MINRLEILVYGLGILVGALVLLAIIGNFIGQIGVNIAFAIITIIVSYMIGLGFKELIEGRKH